MADDCKKGEVYSVKHKKCVTSNPDPDKTWGKYMGGGKYFRTKIATEPEKAVVDSMIKEKMWKGRKPKTKTKKKKVQ